MATIKDVAQLAGVSTA
ncbi:TPA: LacI family DNA-binding transcriptional regulator, partial [Klebsiella oxytoca]|nr:LacI family DNA-binding transcriptional regulator [Klebsiella oxytoca]